MTWAEFYDAMNIPASQRTNSGTLSGGTTSSGTTATTGTTNSQAAYSLANLFPEYFGNSTNALATTAFGGKIKAGDEPATAMNWRDFFETVRRYNQDYDLAKVQDARNFGENVRQFQSQFDEANRRYNQEFPWLQKRDAWSIAGASFLPNARFLTR